CARDHSGYDNC
nr:immunoglobulin heavy chain junction region [Macaca mulatta]